MAKRDYYEILGIEKKADAEEIKKAYRKLAMHLHPDRNPGDKEAEHKFKELNEAYEVLKDPQKRAAYDQYGHRAFEGRGAEGAPGGFDFGGFGLGDIFEQMFGGAFGGRAEEVAGRGLDLRLDVEISLEEAFTGFSRDVSITKTEKCDRCNGTGAAEGSKPEVCKTCSGFGVVRTQAGFFTMEHTCSKCRGTGSVISNPCKECHGVGNVKQRKSLRIDIPAGVDNGSRLRLAGEGNAGTRGAASGDLYVFVTVKPHKFFLRNGADLYCKTPVSMVTAALGGEIEIPLIEGGIKRVSIPHGTQSGHRVQIKHHGMSVIRSHQRGDLYIDVLVETPVNLNKQQQELLREFAKTSSGNSPIADGFAEMLRTKP